MGKQRERKNEDLCVYVAIASYCEKRHAYRDRCEIRHGPERKRKIVRVIIESISNVINYLNGGTGDDEDVEEGLVIGKDGFEDIEGVMG